MKLIFSVALGAITGILAIYGLLLPQTKASEEVNANAQSYLMNLSMTQKDAYVLVEECRKTDKPNKCVMYA